MARLCFAQLRNVFILLCFIAHFTFDWINASWPWMLCENVTLTAQCCCWGHSWKAVFFLSILSHSSKHWKHCTVIESHQVFSTKKHMHSHWIDKSTIKTQPNRKLCHLPFVRLNDLYTLPIKTTLTIKDQLSRRKGKLVGIQWMYKA